MSQMAELRRGMTDEDADDLAEVLAFVDACEADPLPIGSLEDEQERLKDFTRVPAVFSRLPEALETNRTENPRLAKRKREIGKEGKKAKYRRPVDYNPNRAREEQRKELVGLRNEVQELEQRLSALRATLRGAPGRKSNQSPSRDSSTDDDREKEKQVWKELMLRQIELRTSAESERKRLQRDLELQKKVISELQHLAFCRVASKSMDFVSRTSMIPHSIIYNFDTSVFGSMVEQVESRYRNIDQVFADDALCSADADNGLRCGSMREDASGHLYFQIFGSKVFPFDVERVADTAWERFGYSVRPNDSEFFFQDFTATENSIAEVFGTELKVDDKKAAVSALQVKRFYREKDRIAIVWQANVNTVEFEGRKLFGATYQENGYFLIERPPLAPNGFAMLRTCYVLTPIIPTRSLARDSLELTLVEYISKWMTTTIPANHQILEDRLVFESLGGRKIRSPQELARAPANRLLLAAQRAHTEAT